MWGQSPPPAGNTAGGGGSDRDAQLRMSRSGSWKEQQSEPGMRHWPGMALPNSSVMPRGRTEGKGAFPTPTQEDEWC